MSDEDNPMSIESVRKEILARVERLRGKVTDPRHIQFVEEMAEKAKTETNLNVLDTITDELVELERNLS